MRRTDLKPVADLLEQFAAARRCRGKNQHEEIMAGRASIRLVWLVDTSSPADSSN
jgi:hypothetical protein